MMHDSAEHKYTHCIYSLFQHTGGDVSAGPFRKCITIYNNPLANYNGEDDIENSA